MHRRKRWILVCVALGVITASCGEPPAVERHDSAPTAPLATTVARLPLKDIMQGIGRDLMTVANGFWVEDHQVIQQAARRIADHPKVTPEQMVAIKTALGSDFPGFVRHDKDVHEAAVALAEAANSMESVPDMFDDYLRIQRGCVSCHAAFRTRISEALSESASAR